MNYELAKQLKDAGFPQKKFDNWGRQNCFSHDNGDGTEIHGSDWDWGWCETDVFIPNLSELIEACGDEFLYLEKMREPDEEGCFWATSKTRVNQTNMPDIGIVGSNPEEAVAKLWLKLNKK